MEIGTNHRHLLALTIASSVPVADAPAPEAVQTTGEPQAFTGEPALALERGLVAFRQGRYREAPDYFQEARHLKGTPTSRVTQNWLRNAHSGLGNHDAALQSITAALELEDNAKDRVSRGTVLMDKGDCPGATKDARAALDLEPATAQGLHTHAEAHVILANCHGPERDLPTALEHAEEAWTIARAHGYADNPLQAIRQQRESIRAALEGRVLLAELIFGPPIGAEGIEMSVTVRLRSQARPRFSTSSSTSWLVRAPTKRGTPG